jgi:DNA topoisomerase-2
MESTIVGIAQNFSGSNNIPLFDAKGQFGNRLSKKASAGRYIKAKLSSSYRALFKREDDLIITQHISNGMAVEPHFFTPILPLVLVNGAEGMGTGHSTYILSYNPTALKDGITAVLNGKKLTPGKMLPYWNGFNGTVRREVETNQVVIEGKYEIEKKRFGAVIKVTELPVGMQSDAYEAHLLKMEKAEIISNFDNLSEEAGFEFVITVPNSSKLMKQTDDELKKSLKLISRETENLTVWDGGGSLLRFESAEALLEHWVGWRLARYEDRRAAQIKKLQSEIDWASEKVRFIKFYLANVKFFRDNGKADILARLTEEKFKEADRLLSMPIYNLTRDKIKELEEELDELRKAQKALKEDNATDMFKREIKELKV